MLTTRKHCTVNSDTRIGICKVLKNRTKQHWKQTAVTKAFCHWNYFALRERQLDFRECHMYSKEWSWLPFEVLEFFIRSDCRKMSFFFMIRSKALNAASVEQTAFTAERPTVAFWSPDWIKTCCTLRKSRLRCLKCRTCHKQQRSSLTMLHAHDHFRFVICNFSDL